MRKHPRIAVRTISAAIVILAASMAASAEPRNPYQPVGAPADPKVPARWNRYHDYTESTRLMRAMVAAHPGRAKLTSIGRSYAGREMWLMTITNFKKGSDRDKTAFWIDGAIHANEIQGTQTALYTAWYLLEMYDRNPFITRLVDQQTFYIVPMMSPDSYDAHMHRPNTNSSPRSGQVPVDDDRDGLVNEDPADDLDGDGHITQMRIRDPNGTHKPHDDYPHLMVRVERGERGSYRLLGSEGFDNDGDGQVNEDGDGYYDPNRDWPWNWQPGHIQRGAYRYPFSLPENRAVADFVADHANIAGAQSYHNTGGMILRGPGAKGDSFPSADVAVYDAIAKRGELMLPGYRYMNVADDLYNVHGGELDWFYMMRGIFTFSNELFTSENYFHHRRDDEDAPDRREQVEAFNKYLLFGQGVSPWKEVDHPQYGKVEVGGLTKNWRRQPPSFLLEEECHRNMAFTLYHADQMPRVTIQSARAKPVAGGLIEITAVIINEKLTPSRAAIDVRNRITPPDLVTITGKNVDVVLGLLDTTPLMTEAKEQKRHPERMQLDAVPGGGTVYVRWLVRGKGPFQVAVRSVKGGNDRREVSP